MKLGGSWKEELRKKQLLNCRKNPTQTLPKIQKQVIASMLITRRKMLGIDTLPMTKAEFLARVSCALGLILITTIMEFNGLDVKMPVILLVER